MPSDLRDLNGKKQRDLLWQQRVYKDPAGYKEMKRLYRMLDQLLRVPTARKAREKRLSKPMGGSPAQQLCIVKARIGNTIEGHRTFLAHYLPQDNKSQVKEKPEIFGDREEGDPAAAYQKNLTERHFKFIISPDSQRVDLEALVRTLVKRMEAAKGTSVSWVAAVHTDTAHRHAHLLVNGKDKRGSDIYFDGAFIKSTMREMAREICTALLGPRNSEEIRQYREQTYTALRYTEIDEDLKNYERPYDGEDPRYESRIDAAESIHFRRLTFLAGLDLARRDETDSGRFYLEKGWRNKLKAQGRYNAFLAARRELRFTVPYNLEQYDGETGVIEGQVTKLYTMNDEDRWNHAVLVENRNRGRAWYVPLYYEPDRRLLGAAIRCRARKNEKGQLRPLIQVIADPDTRSKLSP
jgi:hypothetical protein